MKAMVLDSRGGPLSQADHAVPEVCSGHLLIKVTHCGVCRTDLHIIDNELKEPALPLIPGHEIVGTVKTIGQKVQGFSVGDRVGVPWLGWTCGHCRWCVTDRENLCDEAKFTGYTIDGGYAEYCLADSRYCFKLPESYDDAKAAPLLCAGLIGYRSYKMCGDAKRIGIYGFGAAAHIIAQVAHHDGRELYAFVRPQDNDARSLAMNLGCKWAGDSDGPSPEKLDAAIIFAPVGELVPHALSNLDKAGKLVLGGIHMSDLPAMPYEILWQERSIKSVTNLTRADAIEFFARAAQININCAVTVYPLARANEALDDLRAGKFTGAAVLRI
ncbi:MAG: zinc-dependent alcohol dehydrogenase family protein [Candidatus Obscuribacterales bacterium]|nr:zinc-dependent alcohol dehydrogenase family protein [Candidatus Obscuribacterales bacterium]